jgi:hypothetical protein
VKELATNGDELAQKGSAGEDEGAEGGSDEAISPCWQEKSQPASTPKTQKNPLNKFFLNLYVLLDKALRTYTRRRRRRRRKESLQCC